MSTRINCPKCGAHYRIKGETFVQRQITCKKCNTTFSLPPTAAPEATGISGGAPTPGGVENTTVLATDADEIIGQVIGGCKIEKKLGQGGMGAVYKAHHAALDIPVAVKILPPHFAMRDPAFVERFIREARSAAKLQHQNIVGVLNVGQEHGMHFIVMQFVDGCSLQEMLKENKKLPPGKAIDIITQICSALELARKNNIVHRDIKPDNIMLDNDGTAKLADLGLAKEMDDAIDVTQSGAAMGTPHYMSPEQASDAKTADHRSDIYSLGCTLYHMISGEVPYPGESLFTILM
ncbi:MAG: protein kinase domain-containing protein, partial [Alphaproteobacteria bacterium]